MLLINSEPIEEKAIVVNETTKTDKVQVEVVLAITVQVILTIIPY